MKTETLKTLDLTSHHTLAMALLDLSLLQTGANMLSCPDMMFFTRSSLGQEVESQPRHHWLTLARKHQFQVTEKNYGFL